jgi:hypothetical protein
MQLWLVCCLVLFAVAEGWQGWGQIDLSLPLVLIGGIGLAIASQPWSWPPASPPKSLEVTPPPAPQMPPPVQPGRSSISFDIAKPKARS